MAQQVFKTWNQNQMMLLPPSLDELIPQGHMVRFIDKAVERIDTSELLESYKGGGTSAYHPVMLFKVLVYAYANKIFTVRPIAKALREDIHFMWLAGMNRPDFRTISNFRSGRLKPHIEHLFTSLLEGLIEQGYINLKDYFVDGSKWEADANPHSHVWAKNTKRYKTMTQERIGELLEEIDRLNAEEDQRYGDKDLEEKGEDKDLSSQDVEDKLEALKEKVNRRKQQLGEHKQQGEDEPITQARKNTKKAATRIGWVENHELKKLKKYEAQEQILEGRNSYSKTDTDATFMRMKDERLRPGYNTLLATESLFVVHYSLHQNPGESGLLIPHVEGLRLRLDRLPQNIIGDSAYGTLENYTYLENHQIGNYLKFNTFHKETTRPYQNNPYLKDNMPYDANRDEFTCPQGRKLQYRETETRPSANGYEQERRIYECENCSNCPVASSCKKTPKNRTLYVNWSLETYKQQARANLRSEKGVALRKQRNYDVEAVFGQLKRNMGHRRFKLRGLEKVTLEFGLLCMAYNIKTWFERESQQKQDGKNTGGFFPNLFLLFYLIWRRNYYITIRQKVPNHTFLDSLE
ncbi:MAG: IS1182 family transposase [Bacteroidales bacterium]|nr:IS1182 family transposase [Bacteroidales bacterium]